MSNEGLTDRVLRVLGGGVLLGLVAFPPHTPLGWLGLIPLFTGVIGFCPIYRALGVNTS